MIEATMLTYYEYQGRFHTERCLFYPEEDIKEVKDSIKKLIASNKIEDDDLVFFHTSSNIPRYKFLNYCSGRKTRRVINVDKATKIVMNAGNIEEAFNKHFRYPHSYYIIPHNFFDSIITIKGPTPIPEGEDYFLSVHSYRTLSKKYAMPPEPPLSTPHYMTSLNTAGVGPLDTLKHILESQGQLVSDDAVNKQMCKDGITIDESNYEEFKSMLKSNDRSIQATGIELLANSNYEESVFYISLLLNTYHPVINSVGANTVNIKNFLEYFRDIAWQDNQMRFLNTLREKLIKGGSLDETKDDYIHKVALEYVNNAIYSTGVTADGVTFRSNPRSKLT